MARRRRSVSRGTRGRVMRQPRPDWVYNSESYTSVTEPLTSGPTNLQVVQLVNSLNTQRMLQFGSVNFLGTNTASGAAIDVVGSWERPGGRRDRLHAFQGIIEYVPSTWTTSSNIRLGCRLIVLPQDALTGSAIIEAFYSMWIENTGSGNALAKWANEARLLAEWRFFDTFNAEVTNPLFHKSMQARIKWRLKPEDGLFLLVESETSSANIRYNLWCRTLMSGDKG